MKTAITLIVWAVLVAPAWAETITNCKYRDNTQTLAICTVDGKPASVPVAPGNRHWDQIVAQQIPISDPD